MDLTSQPGSPAGNLSTDFQRDPTVNNQFEPGYVFRLVRSEIQAGVCNVPGIAYVPHRALGITNLPHLLDVAFAVLGSEPRSLLDHGGLRKAGENRRFAVIGAPRHNLYGSMRVRSPQTKRWYDGSRRKCKHRDYQHPVSLREPMDAGARGHDPSSRRLQWDLWRSREASFVVIIPVEDDGRLSLVKQFRYPVKGRYWEFPQGSWEQIEVVDPLEMARGELREETGLDAAEMTYVGHLFEACGYSNQGFHIFLATGLRHGDTDREDEEQDLVTRDFALSEVERMICDGQIKDATTVAALGLLRLKGLL